MFHDLRVCLFQIGIEQPLVVFISLAVLHVKVVLHHALVVHNGTEREVIDIGFLRIPLVIPVGDKEAGLLEDGSKEGIVVPPLTLCLAVSAEQTLERFAGVAVRSHHIVKQEQVVGLKFGREIRRGGQLVAINTCVGLDIGLPYHHHKVQRVGLLTIAGLLSSHFGHIILPVGLIFHAPHHKHRIDNARHSIGRTILMIDEDGVERIVRDE